MAGKAEDGNNAKGALSAEKAFLLEDTVPEIGECYTFADEELEKAIKTANIVLDANVLLLPYGAGGKGLAATGEAYKKLAGEGRLFVPSRALREYLRHRPNKIANLLQNLNDSVSKFPPAPNISYPILEGIDEFDELILVIERYKALRKELIEARERLHCKIVSWRLRDPVFEEYRKSIPVDAIRELEFERDKIMAELEHRYEHSVPPGYKDASKDDRGIGDYLIWKTILKIGEETKKSTIFISGEEKSDWQHRVNNSGFLPRFELIEEYRRVSSGGSFYIINLSELLEFLDTKPELVEEIKLEEQRVNSASNPLVSCPYCEAQTQVYLASAIGSSASPNCNNCRRRFHVHRIRDGVIANRWGESDGSTSEFVIEQTTAVCPQCGKDNDVQLGAEPGSTRWLSCKGCQIRLSVHRQKEGGLFVNVHQ